MVSGYGLRPRLLRGAKAAIGYAYAIAATLTIALTGCGGGGGGFVVEDPSVDELAAIQLNLDLLDCLKRGIPELQTFRVETEEFPGEMFIENEMTPVEAVDCLIDLAGRTHVAILPDAEVQRTCGGGADGCTLNDHQSCGADTVILNLDRVPSDVTEVEVAPRGRASVVDTTTVAFHEAIHTEQTEFEFCQDAREAQAYSFEVEYLGYVGNQVLRSVAPIAVPECGSLDDAVTNGMPACIRSWIINNFDSIDEADAANPLPASVCERVRALITRAASLQGDRAWSRDQRAEEDRAGECVTRAPWADDDTPRDGQHAPLVRTAAGRTVAYDDATGHYFEYEEDTTGDLVLVRTTSSQLSDAWALYPFSDASGHTFLAAVGVAGGAAAIEVLTDAAAGGVFDDEFDGPSWIVSDPRLNEATALFATHVAGDLLVWDREGQRAYHVSADANQLPQSIGAIALTPPAGISLHSLSVSDDSPDAIGTIGARGYDSHVLLFEDGDSDGFYRCSTNGEPGDVGRPPVFENVLAVGESTVWIRGTAGDGYVVQRYEGSGPPALVATGTFDASRRALVTLSLPATSVTSLDVRDTVTNLVSATLFALDRPGRAVTVDQWPRSFDSTGGILTLTGVGFPATTSVTLDGAPVSAVVDGPTRMSIVVPSGLATGAHLLESATAGVTSTLGGVFVEHGSIANFSGTLLAGWSTSGSGWSCGAVLTSGTDANPHGFTQGCVFDPSGTGHGTLSSPALTLPPTSGVHGSRVLILHRSEFGHDGDGFVITVSNGGAAQPARRLRRPARRVHTSTCISGSCPPESGLDGVAFDAQSDGWQLDEFLVPASIVAAGLPITVSITASNNTGSSAPARLELAAVSLRGAREAPLNPDGYGWADVSLFGDTCGTSTGASGVPFHCVASATVPAGAGGQVLRFYGQSPGKVHYSFQAPTLPDRQGRLRVRQLADFSPSSTPTGAAGQLQVCCSGGCFVPERVQFACEEVPIGGGDSPPSYYVTVGDAIVDDRDPATHYVDDQYDVSAASGQQNCVVVLQANGPTHPSSPGWVIDDISVGWR